jgi:CHASE2 domain-containing sensor protein
MNNKSDGDAAAHGPGRKWQIWLPHPEPFLRVVLRWRFVIVVVVLLFFTNWLGHRWLFERATLAGTDVLLSVTTPQPATHTQLITIDEQEYDTYLGQCLEPEKLADVIARVMDYQPKVLVVDIDTSAPRFASLQVPPQGNTRIVWARVSQEDLVTAPGTGVRSYDWKAGSVLGNRADQPQYVGSPLFPQDPDWTVRSFQRMVPIDANAPSLHWVILRAYCDSGSQAACSITQQARNAETANAAAEHAVAVEAREFRVNWDLPATPLSDVMGSGGSAKPQPGALGDVVLLGGKFGDVHATPFGPKLGIELIGSALETELAREKVPWRVYGASVWIFKIFIALFIVWINCRLMPVWAASATFLLLAVTFVASFLGMYYGLFRMEFLPFMIGIWIEQLVESSEHAQHAIQHPAAD